MYTVRNFKSKAALKRAVQEGERVTIMSPVPFEAPSQGAVALEGPHYPEPHRWYANATLKDGVVVKVK